MSRLRQKVNDVLKHHVLELISSYTWYHYAFINIVFNDETSYSTQLSRFSNNFDQFIQFLDANIDIVDSITIETDVISKYDIQRSSYDTIVKEYILKYILVPINQLDKKYNIGFIAKHEICKQAIDAFYDYHFVSTYDMCLHTSHLI